MKNMFDSRFNNINVAFFNILWRRIIFCCVFQHFFFACAGTTGKKEESAHSPYEAIQPPFWCGACARCSITHQFFGEAVPLSDLCWRIIECTCWEEQGIFSLVLILAASDRCVCMCLICSIYYHHNRRSFKHYNHGALFVSISSLSAPTWTAPKPCTERG